MKAHLRISFFIAILIVLFAETNLYAQWKNIAPDLFSYFDSTIGRIKTQGGRGAIHFADGVIWVGVNRLFSSEDSGKTWKRNAFPALATTLIRDIYFLDKWNGLVATSLRCCDPALGAGGFREAFVECDES